MQTQDTSLDRTVGPSTGQGRVGSIDLLRGAVIVVMTLDHVRDFTHHGAMVASPTDLATTTPLLFATRWITHVCAPGFALTAGLGAWLRWRRDGDRAGLSRYLVTRGLWLMVLELALMQFAYAFSWSPGQPVFLLVLWSLGLSMIALAGLVWMPLPALGVLAVAAILLHPLLADLAPGLPGWAGAALKALHQVSVLDVAGTRVFAPYPLIPWVAVMGLGFVLGPLYTLAPARRRARLLALAVTALALFVALRLVNIYGDPVPWGAGPTVGHTLMSFLNTSKYPASPAFLLMTLGLVTIGLASLDRFVPARSSIAAALATLGRTPLLYYVLHFYVAHLLATALAFLTYGWAARDFVLLPYPSLGGPAERFPTGFGYSLAVTYGVWLAVLAICWPVCRAYDTARRRARSAPQRPATSRAGGNGRGWRAALGLQGRRRTRRGETS